MPRPRSQQVSLDATPYYHCISRCVRRAFLCGDDYFSGQSYEHRRGWIVHRMADLAEVFAIDICAYAVMSNHYHVVLRIDAERASSWDEREVAERWMRLFRGSPLVQRWLSGTLEDSAAEARALEIVGTWRDKLRDLSWFMRCLNEHIARQANGEDGCTGRFWEGRFKSQALLDEPAVLACMAYVDLNPVRAGMAELPEKADYTSVQQRIAECDDMAKPSERAAGCSQNQTLRKPRLVPFLDASNVDTPGADTVCDYRLMDYLELIDWTGRALRHNKRGAIAEAAPAIFNRLAIDPETWLKHMRPRQSRMLVAIGAMNRLKQYIQITGRKWLMHQQEAASLSPA